MKRIFSILLILSLAAASATWIVLLDWTPEAISGLSDSSAGMLYFLSLFSLISGTAVLAFGDRCIQFIGAIVAIAAFLGLVAFHSTHTHAPPSPAIAVCPDEQ